MTCRCVSYNQPHPDQTEPERILVPPFDIGRDTVCVDACIADLVQRLWAAGVVTLSSCCGHGKEHPSLVLNEHRDPPSALWDLLAEDGRDWEVLQWRLVTIGMGQTR